MIDRKRSFVAALLLVATASTWAGCSSGNASTTPATTGTSGQEATAPVPPAEPAPLAEPAAPEPARRGAATVTADAAVRGESVPAVVRLIDENGEEAAKGKAGETLQVLSGEYTLAVSIEDPKILADHPTLREPLTVPPGASLTPRVDFPWASVQLNVRVNGVPEKKATVRLLRQGAVVATVESGGASVTLSPGRYQAEVITRDATIEVKMLLFPEGATQSLPVDVKM